MKLPLNVKRTDIWYTGLGVVDGTGFSDKRANLPPIF